MLQKVCKNSVRLSRLAKISQVCLMKWKQVLPDLPRRTYELSIDRKQLREGIFQNKMQWLESGTLIIQNGLFLQINAKLCIWPFALFMMNHHIV